MVVRRDEWLIVSGFRIVYHSTTEDSIFQSKATNNTVIVEVADDDTAGIQVDDGVLQLVEEGEWISFNIHSLGSQPLGDVLLSMIAHEFAAKKFLIVTFLSYFI